MTPYRLFNVSWHLIDINIDLPVSKYMSTCVFILFKNTSHCTAKCHSWLPLGNDLISEIIH